VYISQLKLPYQNIIDRTVLGKFEKSHPQNNFLFEVSLIASCVSYEVAHLFRFYISSGVNHFKISVKSSILLSFSNLFA